MRFRIWFRDGGYTELSAQSWSEFGAELDNKWLKLWISDPVRVEVVDEK